VTARHHAGVVPTAPARPLSFPTEAHRRAADAAVAFLRTLRDVDAVLVVGSAARRGDANDLDLCALVADGSTAARVETRFAEFAAGSPDLRALLDVGPFVECDLHALDGEFAPGPRGWTSGPEPFELEIGNEIVYSVPLWERNDHYRRLRERWLQYYGDELRAARLAEARMYCVNDVDHVPVMVARRTYPIAYDKWIREQVEGLLGLPELYAELPSLIGVAGLDAAAIARDAERLRDLPDTWAPSER
jgi:predicted nucleotidyltransferase